MVMGYAPLFSISLGHQYFASSLCEIVSFHPTAATLLQSRNTGIIFKPTVAGIKVLFDREKQLVMQLYVQDDDEGLLLEFYGISRDTVLSDLSLFPLIRRDDIIILEKPLTTALEARLDGDSNYPLAIDLVVSPMDFCTKESLVSYSQKEVVRLGSGPVFFIRIQLSSQDLAIIFDRESTRGRTVNFTTVIENNKSILEYRVNTLNINDNLMIVDKEESVFFVLKNIEDTFDGKFTAVFRSDSEVELKEYSENYFQLIEKRANGNKVVIRRLPMAQAGKGYQEVVDNKLIRVSEIFINC